MEETESNSWIEFISCSENSITGSKPIEKAESNFLGIFPWWGNSISASSIEFFYSVLNSLLSGDRNLPSWSKNWC